MLVFKALQEWGQTASAHGRRAIAILLFQDAALVPLLLLVPLLIAQSTEIQSTEVQSTEANARAFALLAVKALAFLVAVPVGRVLIAR